MATQLEELDEAPEAGTEQDDQPVEQQDDAPVEHDDAEADDEITFGAERATAEPESEGMRSLRNRLREVEREKRELEQRAAPKQDEVGEKPNLDDYWDRPDEYERELLAWNERQREAGEREKAQREAAERAQQRWEQQHSSFEQGWQDLKLTGKDALRAKVEDAFTPTQQALLVKAARGNAHGLFAMLGSHADSLDKLKALASDPVEFTAEAAVMASGVQVQKRRPSTAPEQVHRGASGGAGKDSKLERLEAEAAKSGDRSELIRYRKQLNGKGK